MKFIIKPDNNSFSLILEANQYHEQWRLHVRAIRRAFREITGLDFQQRVITARVSDVPFSTSGKPWQPMRLMANHRSPERKLITLVHELSHRLLNGNALGLVATGTFAQNEDPGDAGTEIDHRRIYLFEYDVVNRALGPQWAKHCRQHETGGTADKPYAEAWDYAMSLTFEQRQQALKELTAKALTRDQWSD
jgi:hypothetical protein